MPATTRPTNAPTRIAYAVEVVENAGVVVASEDVVAGTGIDDATGTLSDGVPVVGTAFVLVESGALPVGGFRGTFGDVVATSVGAAATGKAAPGVGDGDASLRGTSASASSSVGTLSTPEPEPSTWAKSRAFKNGSARKKAAHTNGIQKCFMEYCAD